LPKGSKEMLRETGKGKKAMGSPSQTHSKSFAK
jgi:hypothetical protein